MNSHRLLPWGTPTLVGPSLPCAELTDSHGKHAQGSRRKAGDVRGERAGEVVWAGGGAR
jgi:hypothetical protein